MKKVNGWRVNFEPEQIGWLERRSRVGGRVFVAARRQGAPETFWLYKGTDARLLVGVSLREVQPLILTSGRPALWPWPLIEARLTE